MAVVVEEKVATGLVHVLPLRRQAHRFAVVLKGEFGFAQVTVAAAAHKERLHLPHAVQLQDRAAGADGLAEAAHAREDLGLEGVLADHSVQVACPSRESPGIGGDLIATAGTAAAAGAGLLAGSSTAALCENLPRLLWATQAAQACCAQVPNPRRHRSA
eukprot:CAMPEP_0179094272 /NCGR_PEP_ID=MMETSP0796-20121207/43225_1 /TAXON_ID=73915 /ORGANISM="Pyrodinium bahamense, Strain pbaha01" /LENGTH=158 /DNA_ID=CAMNT_0020791939 /DNA_START=163 /DNA_END=636 /DNA_ORIENTATION=+